MYLDASTALSCGLDDVGMKRSSSERYNLSFPTLATTSSSCTMPETAVHEHRTVNVKNSGDNNFRILAKIGIICQFSAASASIILSIWGLTAQEETVLLLVRMENATARERSPSCGRIYPL